MRSSSIKRALISVYDKTGIVDFARALVEEFSVELISTGGTASLLTEHGLPVTPVENVTGFGEMMDGRVKTLHPKIHAGILADRDNPDHMRQLTEQGIEPIDLVVVNLYPFAKTVVDPKCTIANAIEMIDIGGPCMIRAAAKNHSHVLIVTDSQQQSDCLAFLRNADDIDEAAFRLRLANAAYEKTCAYDLQICRYMRGLRGTSELSTQGDTDQQSALGGVWPLRYGENPHQRAEFISGVAAPGAYIAPDWRISGDDLSFNNYVDATAALACCKELTRELCGDGQSAVVFVKHTNPCGASIASDPVEAYRKAYLGDANAAMGGVLACNFEIDSTFASVVMESYSRWGKQRGAGGFFVEVWVAPSFTPDAVELIQTAKAWGKRVRLQAVGEMDSAAPCDSIEHRDVGAGSLAQTVDGAGLDEAQWKVVTKQTPTEKQLVDLRLAWLVCKHTKSNAITVCRDGMLIGNGAGQMSRVMSCRIATWAAKENGHSSALDGAVAASDAFFPFPDGPAMLIDAGVKAIIQPGGSKRDGDTIEACDERDAAMICTGTRHFKH